ncbi:SusD/RagB family nutrient-binding outer membrane lipoprotein [Flavobacterium sp. 3HN19-14]|uniref:SusD/RagB family nutrient-binding outer membrane lipoprotein n=1 Tax=Flavobacterium sp. 3HN19-14 TaxID=3448133 RepID=UPI003EE20F03
MRFVFFSQYWAETTYNDETRYRLTTRAVPDNHWNNLYRNVLGNLASARDYITAETNPGDVSDAEWTLQQQNKQAIIEILQVYTFQVLVDTYGDVPYTDALQPATIKLPTYEDDAAIYPKLITRLDAALAQLTDGSASFANGEYLFDGDVATWKRFANSLKVKIGINLADVSPALAQSTVESGFNGGVITDNSQNASFNYPAAAPNYNPIYGELVASNRNDFIAANTFINALEAMGDPRIDVYFNPVAGSYIGGNYGFTNNPYAAFSQIDERFRKPDLPGQLFEATEMNFYLAEAAARGYAVGGSAEDYYNAAIRASFEFWGLTPAQADTYLTKPTVAYATADGDFKQKIGMQAWYALYNRPFESWTSYRRLNYPALAAPSNAVALADGEVPKRLNYPVNERTVNGDNYNAAVEAIGGTDRLSGHVFWDVN